MPSVDDYVDLLNSSAEPSTLSDREKLILRVGDFATELDMGGLSTFLYNTSPDASSKQSHWSVLRETVDALQVVNARKAARALQALLPKLESSVEDDGTWSGFLEARAIDLDGLEDVVEGYDDLFRLLDAHLAAREDPPSR